MVQIRIDQSHCNFHLSGRLREDGWNVVFTDAGRVSRGGVGTQGQFLKIFEENGFPIPDIVAIRKPEVLIIEIDSALAKARQSLQTYKTISEAILAEVNQLDVSGEQVLRVVTGFCRTGLTADLSSFAQRQRGNLCGINVLTGFERPGEPILLWLEY